MLLVARLPPLVSLTPDLFLQDLQGNRISEDGLPLPAPVPDKDNLDPMGPPGRVSLRANLLKGHIILGNYGVSLRTHAVTALVGGNAPGSQARGLNFYR